MNEKMEFARPPSVSPSGAQRISRVGRRRVVRPQISRHTPVGEPRAMAPARRSGGAVGCPRALSGYILANASSAWSDSKSDSRFDGYCLISLFVRIFLTCVPPVALVWRGSLNGGTRVRNKHLQVQASLVTIGRAR